MFKQLKNRFLILNLVIISTMMLISFAAIYLLTYQNVHKTINDELDKTLHFYEKFDNNPNNQHLGEKRFQNDRPDKFEQLADRSVSFLLVTDKQYKIISKASSFSMDDTLYKNAEEKALSQKKVSGTFKLNGNDWAFVNISVDGGYRLVFIDITSQKRILTTLIYTFMIVALVMIIFIYFISRFFANRSIMPVKDAFDKQQQFIADASHELKTPLAVINTNVDLLLSYGEDTINNQSKWLYYIKSESERMAKLTNDLLYLTQMDTSNNKMTFSDFNLSEVVENIILTMEAIIFEHDIKLDYNIEPDLMTHGSSEQIREAVMILVDNALKYTNKAGAVNISLKKRNNDIVLTVANSGKGISPEHLERIFDRFYRADKSRSRNSGGHGLGLAIAKTIINQHKGRIHAKSTVNEWTVFNIELPLACKR